MKIETFFQDLAWTEKLFDHDERRQNVFNMLKPFVDKDDLELAIAMGDLTLIIPIWIGHSRQTLKKKNKPKQNATDHVPLQDDIKDQIDDIIYTSADPSPESSPDLINVSPPQIQMTPVIPDPETHALSSEF